MTILCPTCQRGTANSVLGKSYPFMLVKESCTDVEMEYGIFTPHYQNKNNYTENTTSYYLGREMGMVGLNIATFNLSCLYMHNPVKFGRTKDEQIRSQECENFSVSELIKVAKDMKIIFMMGASLVKTFTGYNSSEVYGLVCKSDLLPNVPVIIPAPNSDKLMRQSIGEMRNALKVLAEQVQIYKEYANA